MLSLPLPGCRLPGCLRWARPSPARTPNARTARGVGPRRRQAQSAWFSSHKGLGGRRPLIR